MTLEERNEKLDQAKAWCESHEWIQGNIKRGEGYCAMGAVCYGVEDGLEDYDGERGPLTLALDNASTKLVGHWQPATVWNDFPGRTKAEVLALFDLAKEMPL